MKYHSSGKAFDKVGVLELEHVRKRTSMWDVIKPTTHK